MLKALAVIAVETGAGLLFAVFGYLLTAVVVAPLSDSDKVPGFAGIVLGAPLFCAGGICVVDGSVYGFKRFTMLGLLAAFGEFAIGMFFLLPFLRGNMQALTAGLVLAMLSAISYRCLAARKKVGN